MKQVDLHSHTQYSVDGWGMPQTRVELAASRGLAAFAITDHNSIDAIPAAIDAAQQLDLRFIPGVELDLYWDEPRRVSHFLCYWFDHTNEHFRNFVTQQNAAYDLQTQWILEELRDTEFATDRPALSDWVCVKFPLSRQCSLWRLAMYLQENGRIDAEAAPAQFLINRAKSAFPRPFSSLRDALPIIRDAGGLIVMAHPGRVFRHADEYEFLADLLEQELIDGFELYHKANPPDLQPLIDLQRRFDCAVTGGSDCHNMDDPNCIFGVFPAVPATVLKTMERQYKKRYGRGPALVTEAEGVVGVRPSG